MSKSISVVIPKKGLSTGTSNITYEANGYKGTACKDATGWLEKCLGPMLEETIKPEMYAVEESVEQLRLNN